jgi:quercetin dioxygenase-like cupin family protein
MKIEAIPSHAQSEVTMDGARDVKMRMLIGPAELAPNFHMRHFEVQPGGNTPHHAHDYEHEIIVLRGTGTAKTIEGDRRFQAGDVIFVPANEKHAFVNTGDSPCEFICLIPAPKDCTT